MAEPGKEFFISAGETTEGPFDLATLRSRVASGQIGAAYQVWDDKAQDWAPFSTLEPLLRPAAAEPAVAPRKVPVKTVRSAEGKAAAAKALAADEPAPRVGPAAAEPFKGGIAPRQSPTQRPPGTGTFNEEPSRIFGFEDEEAKPAPTAATAATETPAPTRRRNYSPQSVAGSAARPFVPAQITPAQADDPVREPWDEPTPAAEKGESFDTPVPAVAADAATPGRSRSPWPLAAGFVVLWIAAFVALWLVGLVSFGFSANREISRLRAENAAVRRQLMQSEAALRQAGREKEEFLSRFNQAAAVIRATRTSIFASTRRELEGGDRTGVDQRLFELDQLNRLVPEDEGEAAIKRELTDRFFSGGPAVPTPPPDPPAGTAR